MGLKMRQAPLQWKKYLFCQNNNTAENTAIIYSILQSCRCRLQNMDDLLLGLCS